MIELATVKGKLVPLNLSLHGFMIAEGYDEDFHCFVDEFRSKYSDTHVDIHYMIYEISVRDIEINKVEVPMALGTHLPFTITNYDGQRSICDVINKG